MNSYELSRAFTDWAFENPHKVKPIHYAVYYFAIEHCNRLGWKKVFGFPSNMVMEAIGVKNWKTYSTGLNDLVEFGFIEMIQKSKNQHSSNMIAIVKNTKAPTKAESKALDKALSRHKQKQGTKHGESDASIDKQLNNEQPNKETTKQKTFLRSISDESELTENENIAFSFWSLFKKNFESIGLATTTLDKSKLKPWENEVRLMIEIDNRTEEQMRKVWTHIQNNPFWKKTVSSVSGVRKNFDTIYADAVSKQTKPQNGNLSQDHAELLKEIHDRHARS